MHRQSEKNLLNSNISSTCSHYIVNFDPLTAEIGSGPQQISTGFASWFRYCSVVDRRKPTKLCTMFGSLMGWCTIYTFRGLLPRNGILPGAKFTLRPSLAFFYIGSITARYSSSGRQPNFAAFSRRRHLCSAGQPSRWASAHILVTNLLLSLCWKNLWNRWTFGKVMVKVDWLRRLVRLQGTVLLKDELAWDLTYGGQELL